MPLPVFPTFMLNLLIAFAFCLIFAGIAIHLTCGKFKKSKANKIKIIAALSLIGVATSYFIFYTICSIAGRSAVNIQLNKMKAAGISIEKSKLIPKKPEYPADNAANLYTAACTLLKSANFTIEYCNAIKNCKKPFSYTGWKNNDKGKFIKLAKNKKVMQALALFEEGAQKAIAVNVRKYDGIQTLLPNLSGYRSLFRMSALKSNVLAMEGNKEAAYKILSDGFKFIYQFRNEPTILDQLVYMACAFTDLEILNHLIVNYGINNARASEMIAALDRLNFLEANKTGIKGEIMMYHDLVQKFAKGDPVFMEALNVQNSFWQTTLTKLYPFFYQGWANYLKLAIMFEKTFNKPFYQCKKELDDFKRELASAYALAKFFLPNFVAYRTKVARINSYTAATKIILALHIYKNKHGKFPKNLDSLVPVILKEIAVDPITGKAYGYKKEGKYFKLSGFYSGGK